MNDYSIAFRRLSEMTTYAGVTPCQGDLLYISAEYQKALLANPYVEGDAICQKVGYVDGKPGGRDFIFPLRCVIDERIVEANSGSCLSVEPWARKSGLGLPMADFFYGDENGAGKISTGAGISQMALRIHKFLGYTTFEFPRMICLLHSRPVVEMFLHGFLSRVVSKTADAAIWIYAKLVGWRMKKILRRVTVELVNPANAWHLESLERLVQSEKKRFSEAHDKSWFKWVLTNSFSQDGSARAYLIERNGKSTAFYMTKRRYYAQASHRGFKNVWLESLVEWGCEDGEYDVLWAGIVVHALRCRADCDAFELPAFDERMCKSARRIGWRQVGKANCAFMVNPKCREEFASIMEDMSCVDNWRLRPGMADVALS